MTKVKICGMRREEDLELAKEADYLGFVVEAGSRRSLSSTQAKELMQVCERKKVMVLTSQDPERIDQLINTLEPDVVQLHSPIGVEIIQEIAKSSTPIWALVSIGAGNERERAEELYNEVQAVLLDSHTEGMGGSGIPHDWSLSRDLRDLVCPLPVVLSGGLRPENVRRAISHVTPAVVDVSSGVEENGVKNGRLIQQFIEVVRSG